MSIDSSRRKLVTGFASALLLSGCDSWSRNPGVKRVLASAEGLTMRAQRLLLRPDALAREYTPAQMSPDFRANGNQTADSDSYRSMLANNFADYRLRLDGLVDNPLSLSLEQLRAMPARTQITRHDCVEGWSAIGQWTGVPLSRVLDLAGLQEGANYVVFHCADSFGTRPYYESIDLVDALHPQTILAYGMNGRNLPERHGAPLRLRVERQLGYKHAKYVMRLQVVANLNALYGGRGGYWEDRGDYAWYAGI